MCLVYSVSFVGVQSVPPPPPHPLLWCLREFSPHGIVHVGCVQLPACGLRATFLLSVCFTLLPGQAGVLSVGSLLALFAGEREYTSGLYIWDKF